MSIGKELKGKKIVVWPVYIDEIVSRSSGRRIPKSKAVRKPTIDEIKNAAELLGLNPQIEEKSYPREWWDYRVRVLVDKVAPKRRILEQIASKILELRGKSKPHS
ncbi:MAG: signal recognition particle protein Srp19 [Acidilobaceae archaeon]